MKKITALLFTFVFLFVFTSCDALMIDQSTSPDGTYVLTLEDNTGITVGNRIDGTVRLQKDGVTIKAEQVAFWYGDPGSEYDLTKNSWEVVWQEGVVKITLFRLYEPYDGTRELVWELK